MALASPVAARLAQEIDGVTAQIQDAIQLVKDDLNRAGIAVREIELRLQAVATREVDGQLRLSLFGASAGLGVQLASTDTQVISIKLRPVERPAIRARLTDSLREAMVAVAAGVLSVASQLTTDEAMIELSFEVTEAGEVEVILAGRASQTNVQTVRLVLR